MESESVSHNTVLYSSVQRYTVQVSARIPTNVTAVIR